MNKKIISLGMMLAVNGAFAQTASPSSVTIYGIMDIGVGYSQHSLSADPNFGINMNPVATKFGNQSDTGMFNGGLSASRIGFKGSEDLGGGLSAIFNLETGFNSPNGVISNSVASLASNKSSAPVTVAGDSSLAGQLFNRQANVGLSSSQFGTVTLGRNYTFGFDTLSAYDPMEGSQTFSPLGYSGSYGGGGFTEDFRIDNSVKYKIKFNGFNVGALYKFGGQAGSSDAQSEYQLNAGYENGPFGIQGTYSKVKDGFSANSPAGTVAQPLGTVTLTVADTTAYMLAAGYKIDQFRFRGGYERMNFTNPSNPTEDAGITSVLGYPVSGAVNVTAFNHEKTLNVYFAGVTYDVSSAFSATLAAYDIKQNDYSAGACNATGTNVASCSGTSRFYSLLADYKLSKRTDLYAGYMYNKVEGGFSSGFLHDSNSFVGTGIRHAF